MRTHTSVHRALTTVFAPPPLQTPVELPDVLLAQASILFYANRHREAVLEEAGAEEPVAGDKEEQEQLQAALAASLQLLLVRALQLFMGSCVLGFPFLRLRGDPVLHFLGELLLLSLEKQDVLCVG